VKLAILELRVGPGQERASAREILESMVSDKEFGLIALRALARDALERQDLPAALAWSGRACELPSAQFSDQMVRLQALFSARYPEYERWLAELERRAFKDPRFAFDSENGSSRSGAAQSSRVVGEHAQERERRALIGVLLADCYSALNRWEDLESLAQWAN
jgi:hypothetical protein